MEWCQTIQTTQVWHARGSKLEDSKGTCTKAMQNMKQMESTTQNSPKAYQCESKTCMDQGQNKL